MTITHLRRSYDTTSRRWIELKCNKLDEMGRVRISSSARPATDWRRASPLFLPFPFELCLLSPRAWRRSPRPTTGGRGAPTLRKICAATEPCEPQHDDDMCFTLVRCLMMQRIQYYPCPRRAPLPCCWCGLCARVLRGWCARVDCQRFQPRVRTCLVPQPALQCRESRFFV